MLELMSQRKLPETGTTAGEIVRMGDDPVTWTTARMRYAPAFGGSRIWMDRFSVEAFCSAT